MKICRLVDFKKKFSVVLKQGAHALAKSAADILFLIMANMV